MSRWRHELAERAGATLLESKQDAAARVVGGIYKRLAAPEALAQHEASKAMAQDMVESVAALALQKLVDVVADHNGVTPIRWTVIKAPRW